MSDPRHPNWPPPGPPAWPPADSPQAQPNPWATPGGQPNPWANPGPQPYGADQVGYAGGWDANVYGGGPPPRNSTPWPWVGLGVGVLVLLLLVGAIGGVALLRSSSSGGGGGGPAEPTSSPLAGGRGSTDDPTDPTDPTDPPPKVKVPRSRALPSFEGKGSAVVGRIEDPEAGFSYALLGEPWRPIGQPWGDFTAGQEFVTERGSDGGTWHATIFSGPLPDEVQAYCRGSDTLPEMAAAAAQQYADRYYTDDYERADIASQEVQIDGHPAYVIGFELSFDPPYPGMTVTKEIAVIAAIDTGKKYPGVLYLSIPGTHYQLRPDITGILDSVKVPGPKPSAGPGGQPTQAPDTPPLDGAPQGGEESCLAPQPSPGTKF